MGTYDIFKKRYAKEQTVKPASSASKKTEKVETAKPETVEAEKPSSGMRSLDYFYNHTKAPEPVKANTLESLSASVTPATGIVHGGRGRSFGTQRPVTAEASNEPARKQTVRPEFADQGISSSRGDTQILTGEPYNLTREGQWAAKHPIAGTLMYGVSNLVGGAEGFINTGEAALRALATGEKMNPHDIHAAPVAQAFRTGAAEGFRREAEESHPRISSALGIDSDDGRYTFGEKATDFLTGVGADAVSSSISMATGGPLSTLLMGGSAANQSLYETSNDPNTTARQAAELALANGAAEAFFEHFSVERLLNFQNPTSTAQAVRTALAQAGVEASEEMFTEIANTLSDIAIRKDYSERGREYQDYIKQGMDPNAAATNTMRSAVTQIFLAGLGGALSGGLHTGAAMYGNTIANGMDLRRDLQSGMTLEDIAESIDTSTAEGQRVQDIANDIAQREASGTRASDTDLGYLSNAIANAAEVAERNEAVEGAAAPVEGTVEGTQDVVSETTERENTARQAAAQAMNDVASETAKDTGEAFRNANYYNSQRMTAGERIFNAEMAEDMASTFGEEGQKAFSALPAEEGVKAYREWAAHYNNMRFGMPIREGMNTTLSPEQISAAMRAGALDANRAYPQDTMKAVNRAVNKISVNGVNAGNTDLSGIDYKSLTPQQKLRVDYTSTFITKGLGMDVRYVKSEAVDGKYKGMNGSFQVINGRPTITLDVNAGMNRESDWTGDITDIKSMLPVISHETTHFLEQYNPKLYKELSNTVLTALQNNGTYSKGMTINSIIEAERQRLNDTIKDENGKPVQHTQDDAIHELVARACEDMLSGDKKALDAFNSLDANTKQTLWDHVKQVFDNIREFFSQMLSSYKSDSAEAKAIRQNMEEFEKIRDMWSKALNGESGNVNAADRTALHDAGISISDDGNVAHMEYSVRYTWVSEEQQAKAVAALQKSLGISKKKAQAFVQSEMSLTNLIMSPGNIARMDYDPDQRYSAIKKNSDYPQGTVDFNNNCRKRVPFTEVFNRLQERNPNRVFTAEDLEIIRQEMIKHKVPVACALCYVEERRQRLGEIAQGFVDLYKNDALLDNFSGKKEFDKIKAALDKTEGDDYQPNIYDLITYDGLKKLTASHPGIAEAFKIFNNARGMQSGRLVEGRAEYKRELLKYTPAQVKRINDLGGLRVFSYSDFEAVNLLDLVQIIQDAAVKGIKIQAYTKVPAFAKVVRNTGIKLNRSLIAHGTGVRYENGQAALDLDPVEGIDINDPDFFDSTDDRDIGNILVGMSDEQIRLAMASDFVDYIIPFHTSLPGTILKAKGIDHWTNYKLTQNERDKATGNKAKNVNIYTDVLQAAEKEGKPIRTKKQFVNKFLEVCKERNLIPRFSQFLNVDKDGNYVYTEGYHKFLIDFKLFDKNGRIVEQQAVRPEFDDAYNTKLMEDFANGVGSTAISNEMYNDVVNALNEQSGGEKVQYSTRLDSLTDKQKKNYQYNEKQTDVGETLKTLKGSAIKRSKYGVGKEIGGQFYFNKEYASDIIPDAELNQAISILAEEYPNFQYNCMMYQPSKSIVRFDEAADFDTAREPMTGDYVSVNIDTGAIKTGHSNYIWHHKWLWVKNDYKGFDVGEAWNWSKTWLNTLTEVADGNGIGRWEAQLDKYGLPHDGDKQYSSRLTRGQKYTGEDTSVLQIPGTFTHFEFPEGTRILDYGGGQFNFAKDAVEKTYPGVTIEIMDAFNRTSKHNDRISDEFDKNKADAVTVNNVLNVIDSRDARIGVIEQAKRYLKNDGVAYFLMYQADKKAESGEAKGSQKDESRRNYQTNMDQRAYIPEIKEVFDYVTEVRSGGDIYLLASNIPLTKDMYKLSDQNSPQVKYLRSIKGDKAEKAKYNTLSQRYGEATIEILDSEYENAANAVLKNGEIGDTATIKKIVDHLAVRENLDKKTVRDLYKIKRDANGNVIPLSQRVEIHDENIRYSMRDSAGNELTEAQAEYFKDSKVRDENGNLLRVYHGTNSEFYEFDRNRIGAHGSYEGAGFNFTPSSTRAGGYKGIGGGEGRVMEGYLNITNPLSAEKKTMTVRQLAKLIEKIDPTGDDLISNYAQDTRDYGRPSFVRREALYTARQMMNYHDSDVDIYSDLSASGASANAIIDAFKNLGYDGLIHYDGNGKINTLIAFDSKQFKNIDNENPTEDSDIRFSQRNANISEAIEKRQRRMEERYLARIDRLTAKSDEKIDKLKTKMRNAVGAEKQKARDRLDKLRKEKNDKIKHLEKAYRLNLDWRIAEMRQEMENAVGAEKQKARERLDALRTQKNQQIDDIISEYRETRLRERLKRRESKAQQELLRRARRLAGMKGDPDFRAQVDALIGDLDLVAAGIRDDTQKKLEEIRKQVEAQSELDPDYAKYEAPKYAKLLERPGKKHISQMSIEDILQLTESIVALEHSKRTADHEIGKERRATFGYYGKVATEQLEKTKGINYKNEIGAQLGKYKLNMLNPTRAFSLIDGYQRGGVFTYFGKELNDGQTKAAQFRMEVEKMFQDIDNNPKLVNDFAKQDIEIDTLEGKKKISKGMRIALYLHLQNPDNVKHIAFGGITIPNERLYSRGKYAEAYAAGETVHLSEWDPSVLGESVSDAVNRKNDAAAAAAIRKITDQMTPEELEYAEIAYKFFNETTKDAINEVSLALNGYEKAIVDDYFPISTNKNFLQSSYDGLVKDGTLEGMGMLKERSGSHLPIYLEDASQVVLRQKNNTALYYGLAVPIRNFTRFYNYTGGERLERSVKASVGKTWGKTALDYIDNVLSDLQFGRQTQRGITDTLKSIHAGATLNLNLGVAIKQSASYPFAASVIGWGPLAKAARHVVSKADREYMDSITPWGYMRRTGFSGTEMGEVAKQRTGIDNNRTVQRVKTALDLIRQVDVRTTEVLFFACEEYVKDKYPDLEVRGSEYNRRLADIYNETLQRTQPSYDVMQRNEYLRKQNDIAKIFGAFKTQTFNMGGEVIDAWSRWRAYSEYAKKDISYVNAKKEAGKAFGNTVAATIVAQGMLVILSAAANAALHRMRDYRDEKGEVTPESIAKKILHDFGTSFAGMTMGGSEAQDFALALLGDGKWYDIDYPGLTLVNDFASAAVDFRKAASKAVETGDMKDIDNASVKMAKLIMQMFKLQGVPAQNVYNIVNAIYLWGTDVKNGEAGTFNAGEGLFGLQDTSPTKEQYAKQAIDAYKNGDIAKGDRASNRTSKDAIKKAMGGKQDDAVRFLKESGLGDTINRKLWEKAGWKSNTYDKSMK